MEGKIPEIVYKYRDWNNPFHKNILLHNEIYLASPKDFNDPFDCRIPMNFINQTPEDRNDYITELAISQSENIEQHGLELEFFIRNVEKEMQDILAFQTDKENYYYDLLDKFYGILSLSKKWNGILLWSHYANYHKGFCIGFWEEKLRASGSLVRTGKVKYPKEFPIIKPAIEKTKKDRLNRIHVQTTTKSQDWKYEKEYRLLKCYFPHEPKPFERLIQFSDEVISEVILGINISSSDKEEIVSLCKLKNISVYQAKKVSFKFEIDRELIE